MKFASELLDQTRTRTELAIMLNYDPDGDVWNEGEVNSLERLKMAIKFSQKSVGGASRISVNGDPGMEGGKRGARNRGGVGFLMNGGTEKEEGEKRVEENRRVVGNSERCRLSSASCSYYVKVVTQ